VDGDLAVLDPKALSGLETLRAMRDGNLPGAGIGALLQMRLADVGDGHAAFELETRPEHGNPLGTVHGGIAATMLDSAMACAVHSTLAPGERYTTVDLAVSYLRAVPYDGRTLRAQGSVVHIGGRIATAEGRLHDSHGRLVATGTTTCMVFRGGER
jgi:uncharacterized protein (TIGR00369 family)